MRLKFVPVCGRKNGKIYKAITEKLSKVHKNSCPILPCRIRNAIMNQTV